MLNWVKGFESGGVATDVPGMDISMGGAMAIVKLERNRNEVSWKWSWDRL